MIRDLVFSARPRSWASQGNFTYKIACLLVHLLIDPLRNPRRILLAQRRPQQSQLARPKPISISSTHLHPHSHRLDVAHALHIHHHGLRTRLILHSHSRAGIPSRPSIRARKVPHRNRAAGEAGVAGVHGEKGARGPVGKKRLWLGACLSSRGVGGRVARERGKAAPGIAVMKACSWWLLWPSPCKDSYRCRQNLLRQVGSLR